jgi:HD-GYP domain-containing protein (c-di-GMP phosphodiesterase class II)
MSDTQVLLEKISALRHRLDQVRGLADVPLPADRATPNDKAVREMEPTAPEGSSYEALADRTLRCLTCDAEPTALPTQLTSRARQLLERGRELLAQLRGLGDELSLEQETQALSTWYRATVAMTDTTIRLVGAFPDAPSAQLRLCGGIDATFAVVADRIARLTALVNRHREETARLDMLADLLTWLEQGKPLEIEPFTTLAETIAADSAHGMPLRFFQANADDPRRFVASHSLNVAQVVARLVQHDTDAPRPLIDAVLAALVHDAGMLRMPVEILVQPGPLADAQRRIVESHTRLGAEWVGRLLPGKTWLAEVTAGHHERINGTGYPSRLRDTQIAPLTRLLAVADVYAALNAPRPYRPALDSRPALTDTLMQAETGALDRYVAERLLRFGFYPPGAVVELADATIAAVIAAPTERKNVQALARPVVAVLIDAEGHPLPAPTYLDLTQSNGGHAIVRSLSGDERRDRLANHYPEFV